MQTNSRIMSEGGTDNTTHFKVPFPMILTYLGLGLGLEEVGLPRLQPPPHHEVEDGARLSLVVVVWFVLRVRVRKGCRPVSLCDHSDSQQAAAAAAATARQKAAKDAPGSA